MDINCGFEITATKSSLSSRIQQQSHKFIVNAFHGYAHNYQCQLKNHPTVTPGAGIEDFETMERIFSASNALATIVRYASPYRRRLYIDAFFRQWDEDKYENLGSFILGNYRQACATLGQDVPALKDAMEKFKVTDTDLDQWEKDESEFFTQLGTEHVANTLQVEYVELLQALQTALVERTNASSSYLGRLEIISETPQATGYADAASATNKLETRRRLAHERYEIAHADVVQIEIRLGIDRRWEPTDPEYLEALKFMNDRKYHRALDKLHRLVVLRLFELHRMNLSGTGMCYLNPFILCS